MDHILIKNTRKKDKKYNTNNELFAVPSFSMERLVSSTTAGYRFFAEKISK
jgi:hypothetical protein